MDRSGDGARTLSAFGPRRLPNRIPMALAGAGIGRMRPVRHPIAVRPSEIRRSPASKQGLARGLASRTPTDATAPAGRTYAPAGRT